MRCDIIIPVWNQPAVTKDCIDSIIKNTQGVDYRLIVIDNASGQETKEYLEAFAREKSDKVRLIRNEENLGFVRAANQGMRSADAPYMCLLNNDTLVMAGWLEEMMAIAERSSDIGIVNPSSNNLGQRPLEGEPLEHYAGKLSGEKGRYSELGAAIGFCMLIKRAVIDRIGLFDEIYGMGNFEDTDFSRKAVKEGFKCVRACGAYVYHRENTSFKKLKTFDSEFNRNREIYEFRWGRPKRIAYILGQHDENELKRLDAESLKLARNGDRVWLFSKSHNIVPSHSNIIAVEVPKEHFYLISLFRILKKKKKFDDIYVSEEKFANILKSLAFIHKAQVHCY